MSSRVLVLDIETYCTRDAAVVARIADEVIDKKCPGNASTKKKAEWDTEEARTERVAEALASTATDVCLAEPLCIGYQYDPDHCHSVLLAWNPDSEAQQLAKLVRDLDELTNPETIWVGHNLLKFDLPILLNRMRKHNVAPPTHFPTYSGRWHGRVFDTMLRTPTETGFIELEEVCRMYAVPMRDVVWRGKALEGKYVAEVYDAGDSTALLEYCLEDVRVCWELYHRMTCDDQWGTYDRGAWHLAVEIGRANLSDQEKWSAIKTLMGVD